MSNKGSDLNKVEAYLTRMATTQGSPMRCFDDTNNYSYDLVLWIRDRFAELRARNAANTPL